MGDADRAAAMGRADLAHAGSFLHLMMRPICWDCLPKHLHSHIRFSAGCTHTNGDSMRVRGNCAPQSLSVLAHVCESCHLPT